ncbi:MAG: tetratricopeptide repeat protein [Candidatus Thermoplasmatota archaeon]|nr:tetratricopeptide repeat protein [Candidatus Thermoplasmatota archaeon]
MGESLSQRLQHPRRSLGDRHRSQAEKFLRLSDQDEGEFSVNIQWAEQNARQALLHDFTHPENWRMLAKIKVLLADDIGIRALLSDLFAVLGRDPEYVSQLEDVSLLDVGSELLNAALQNDHLDSDIWIQSFDASEVDSFVERFLKLDLSDPRCNVLFGRRLERLWDIAGSDVCIHLGKVLLSHRPQNYEMWTNLGRAHERMGDYDQAWLCYDQAQSYAGHLTVRDDFKERMESHFDGNSSVAWSRPEISVRKDFLATMEKLSTRFSDSVIDTGASNEEVHVDQSGDERRLENMLKNGDFSSAFFLSRRLVTSGEMWAKEYLEASKLALEEKDDVIIP